MSWSLRGRVPGGRPALWVGVVLGSAVTIVAFEWPQVNWLPVVPPIDAQSLGLQVVESPPRAAGQEWLASSSGEEESDADSWGGE